MWPGNTADVEPDRPEHNQRSASHRSWRRWRGSATHGKIKTLTVIRALWRKRDPIDIGRL